MENITACLEQVNLFLWNGPLLFLLSAAHLFFSCKFFPQKYIGKAIRLSLRPEKNAIRENNAAVPDRQPADAHTGHGLNSFATLATTLAATLGTGNIVGVSTAIALGGPGALFWCFLTGLLGMATAYCECYLSCLYRRKDASGKLCGGPMYVMEYGLHNKLLGKFYALCVIFAALGVGCTTQSSAMADAAFSTFHLSPHVIGIGAAVLCGFVILGGMRSIGSFCSRLVPPLSILYMGACLLLLGKNYRYLGESLQLVLSSAFTKKAAVGGFCGSTFLMAARFGIARGLFTNEAGIGTSAIAAGASSSENPMRQALVSMTAVFWDTIVMCTLTGFTIISSMLAHPGSAAAYSDAGLTTAAFAFLPRGDAFLSLSLMAFALATLVGWCYLGEKGVTYFFGKTAVKSYHLIYIVMIYFGAILPMEIVWSFTDFINAVMVLPNVLCLFLLYKKIEKPSAEVFTH